MDMYRCRLFNYLKMLNILLNEDDIQQKINENLR